MFYLYVLQSKICGDKRESERVYYGLGTATVTPMMMGATNLTKISLASASCQTLR